MNREPKVPLSSTMKSDRIGNDEYSVIADAAAVAAAGGSPETAADVIPAVVSGDVEIVDPDRQLKDLTRKIRSAHRRIEKSARQMVASVLTLGEHLTTARELLSANKTGSYGAFLKKCDIPRTIAHRAVAAFETFGSCSTVERFDLSAVHALAAPSTPPSAVAESLDLANDDIAIDGKTAKQIIARHKPGRPASTRPEKIILEVDGGFVIIQAASDDANVAEMLKAAYMQLRGETKAAA